MRQCPSCYKEISDTATFCPFCGTKITPGAAVEERMATSVASAPLPPVAGAPAASGATPRPRGKRTGMVVAIVLGVVGLLILGAVIGLGIATGVHYVRGPLDATNTYIEALNSGDAQTAYELLDPEAPQRVDRTLDDFDREVVQPAKGILRSWRTEGVDFPGGGRPGRSRATVTVTESLRTGVTRDFRFLLEKEGSTWLITDYYVL